jgi:hypothetical protein
MTISEFKSITYSICLIKATRRTSQYIKKQLKKRNDFQQFTITCDEGRQIKGITICNTLAHG